MSFLLECQHCQVGTTIMQWPRWEVHLLPEQPLLHAPEQGRPSSWALGPCEGEMNCVRGREGATAGLDLTLVRSSLSTHSPDAVETASVWSQNSLEPFL